MSFEYQSLIGEAVINSDGANFYNLTAQNATIQNLIIPTGAVTGDVLTSDSIGNATWKEPAIPVLIGDATGLANNNQVNTLAGGTIPVTDLVLLSAVQTVSNKSLQGVTALQIPTGAVTGDILTSDAIGNATWQIPAVPVLAGDATGNANANVVNTLAGGNIPVTDLVTLNGTQTLTNKTITGTFTGSLTGNASTATLASTVTTNANLTGMVTSVGNATTVVTNANLTGMVTSVGNATTVVTNANLTGDVTSVGNSTTIGNAPVIAKILTGFTSGAGVVSSSDSILTAFEKLNGNIIASTGVTTATPNTLALRDGSANCSFNALTGTTIKLTTGASQSQVLTSDASGNATWQPNSNYRGAYSNTTQYYDGDQVLYNGNSIYPWTVVPATTANNNFYTLGTVFQVKVSGNLTAVSIYLVQAEGVGQYRSIYLLQQGTGGVDPTLANVAIPQFVTGWVTIPLSSPIAVTPGQNYCASYNSGGLYYASLTANTTPQFIQANNNLVVPMSVRYYAGNGAADLFNNYVLTTGDNFYVDVVFEPTTSDIVTLYQAPSAMLGQRPNISWTPIMSGFANSLSYPIGGFTPLATPNTLALRDSAAGCAFNIVTATQILDAASGTNTITQSGNGNVSVNNILLGTACPNLNGSLNSIYIGHNTALDMLSGQGCVIIGNSAIQTATNSAITSIGMLSGNNNDGAYCTFLGRDAGAATAGSTWTNSTAIGAGASITASNQVVLGATTCTNLVIPYYLTTYNNSNLYITPPAVMNGGIYLPTSGGTQSNLSYYEETTYTSAFPGVTSTVPTVTFSITRVGRVVTITQQTVTSGNSSGGTTGGTYNSSTALPARFCPSAILSSGLSFPIMIFLNGSPSAGVLTINNAGNLNIAPYTGGFNPSYSPIGWQTFSVSYSIS